MKSVSVSKKKSFVPLLLVGCAVVVLGVLCLMYKPIFISLIVVAIGCGVLGQGVYTALHVRKWGFTGSARRFAFARSIILIIIGICSIFLPLAVAKSAVAVLCYCFAFGLAVSSFFTIENAIACRYITGLSCGSFLIEAMLDLFFAAVLVLNPQSFMIAAVSIIAVSLVVAGSFIIILAFVTRKSGSVTRIDVSDVQNC